MTDLSYHRVIKDLHQWNIKITSQIDQMHENILMNMSQAFNDVHYFSSLANGLLIDQENQLEQATTNEEMDLIQDRIDQIIAEIRFLQTLSFRVNTDLVQLTGQLRIDYNNNDIKSISSSAEFLININYRFLISRFDAIELSKHDLPMFHLTSHDNESIPDCVLTLNTSNLDGFAHVFNTFWNFFPNHTELRLLIPQYNISFVMGKLGETSRLLAKRFQLDQIKVFTNSCPKSDERILLVSGKQRDLIRDCIGEIYYNIEERNNQNELIKQNIQFYNPASLSNDDINKIMSTNVDYGGFISGNHSRTQITADEESEEDDLWDENEDSWNIQSDDSETIQRDIVINNIYAGIIIGVNARRIDRLKRKTGAYVYVHGEAGDPLRTVVIRGTHRQVDRAFAYIESLIEKHKHNKFPIIQRHLHNKPKGK